MLKVLRRNKTIAGVLAVFAGTIGLHCFYMGRYKKGLLYLLFFWTGIPTVLGILDGARLFTQVAEEDGFGSEEDGNDSEVVDSSVEEQDDAVTEVLKEEKQEDINEEEFDDDIEEDTEEDEVEEKINSLRKKNSRRKKTCQK